MPEDTADTTAASWMYWRSIALTIGFPKQTPLSAFGKFLNRKFVRVVAVDPAFLARKPHRHGQHIPIVGEPDGGIYVRSTMVNVIGSIYDRPIKLLRKCRPHPNSDLAKSTSCPRPIRSPANVVSRKIFACQYAPFRRWGPSAGYADRDDPPSGAMKRIGLPSHPRVVGNPGYSHYADCRRFPRRQLGE